MFNFNFGDFSTWLSIVIFISMWNCGFVAITRKGKIGYFLLAFFERKKMVNEKITDRFRESIVASLKTVYKKHFDKWGNDSLNTRVKPLLLERIEEVLDDNKVIIFTETETLFLAIENGTYTYFDFYCEVQKDVFPDWIKDPLIVCITCLASVHGTILYSLIIHFRHWHWNVLEWITIIIPVAFVAEFLWKLKVVFDKKIMNG